MSEVKIKLKTSFYDVAKNNVKLNINEYNKIKNEFSPVAKDRLKNKILKNLDKAMPENEENEENENNNNNKTKLTANIGETHATKFNFKLPKSFIEKQEANNDIDNKPTSQTKNSKPFIFKLPIKLVVNQQAKNSITPATSNESARTTIPLTNSSQTFTWDESQLKAINNIINNRYNCLIGAAGSGKTTVVKEVINRLQTLGFIKPLEYQRCNGANFKGYNVAFVSFTGKAVEQLRKAVPNELQNGCMTIHNLLEYAPIQEDYIDENGNAKTRTIFLPRRDASCKIEQNIIIIDEAGMVGVELWNNLFNALKIDDSLKIVLIGDINQLPAVMGKSILGYALSSPHWVTSTLTKIHRQALDNPIIANAHRIIAGKMPVVDNDKPNFRMCDIGSLTPKERDKVKAKELPYEYYDKKNSEFNGYKTVLSVIKMLYQNDKYDPAIDQIITPQNVGLLGQESLNRKLAEMFNPATRTFIRAGMETKFLAIGDKVMFTANDYASGILNGMTGYITEISLNSEYTGFAEISREAQELNSDDARDNSNRLAEAQRVAASIDIDKLVDNISLDSENQTKEQQASHCVTIAYQPVGSENSRTITISTVGALRGLYLAYAITCHKAQGSEYRNVVVICHSASNRLLSREWLYTAVTRAKETLYLIYNDWSLRGLSKALWKQVVKGSTIEEKAKNFSIAEAESRATDDNYEQIVPKGV